MGSARRRGISLFEQLLAVVVLGESILMVLNLFPISVQAARKARIDLLATHHAQSSMEIYVHQSLASLLLREWARDVLGW